MPSLALEVQRGGIPGLPGATPSSVGLICCSEPVSCPSVLLLVYRRCGDGPERSYEVLAASLKKLFGCDPGRVWGRSSGSLQAVVAYYSGTSYSIPKSPGTLVHRWEYGQRQCYLMPPTGTKPHQGWKAFSNISPEPDKDYCNNLPS